MVEKKNALNKYINPSCCVNSMSGNESSPLAVSVLGAKLANRARTIFHNSLKVRNHSKEPLAVTASLITQYRYMPVSYTHLDVYKRQVNSPQPANLSLYFSTDFF